MTFQIFQYGLPMDGQPDDLNRWLATHRVVTVTQYLMPNSGGGGLLVFVVETAGGAAPARRSESRIDYRDVLSPEDFAVYSRLRELRKAIAEKEGVPVFAVFSNAQLAAMVTERVSDPDALKAIAGVGQGRADKFGPAFLAVLARDQNVEAPDT